MAVQHDASVSATGTFLSSLSVALTIANNKDRYLIAHAYVGDGSLPGAFASAAWNTSEALANVWSLAANVQRMEAWGLVNPTATTANVTVNFGASYAEVFVGASSYYGVDQQTPTGVARTNSGSATTGWVATDGGRSGGRVVGAGSWDLNTASTPTVGDVDGVPEFAASGTLSTSTAVTSRAPALPAGNLRGDLVIAHCASENNATHSCATAGWNKLGQTNSGASWTVSHWWAIETGSLSAPTITWTGSADASARTHSLRDTRAIGQACAYLGTVGTGTGATHSSTGANTTANDVRVCYVDHATANTALATPSGWTENTDSGSSTGPCRTTFGGKDVLTSGTASGTISVTGAAAAWVQQQIECLPASGGDQVLRTEGENIRGFGAVAVSDEAADLYNTLGWTFTGGSGTFVGGAVPLNPSGSLLFPNAVMQAFLAR